MPVLFDLADYHRDAESSLRLYFTPVNPDFVVRFAGEVPSEVAKKLAQRIDETDMRSALVVMTRIEAAFRLDYKRRCRTNKSDDISIAFRKLFRTKKENVRLDEDIWELWRHIDNSKKNLISQLRDVFHFRHWLAHGRYWAVGKKYDFQTVYQLADAVFADFPLYG
jgi:hypothetical protein